MMFKTLKVRIRDLLPGRFQVPIKYYFGKICGDHEEEMKLLKKLVRREGRFIDVGANRGVYAYSMVEWCKHIELFEPNPDCAAVLNSFAAARSNLHVFEVALSDSQGEASLRVPIDASGVEHDSSAAISAIVVGRFREYCVRLTTLDSFLFGDVDLIKIDVEGHESCVINGAVKTISSQMPALLIEIEQRHLKYPISDVFRQVQNLGYEGFFLNKTNMLRPLSEFDLAIHQLAANFSSRGAHYINNFVFLHRKRLATGEYHQLTYGI